MIKLYILSIVAGLIAANGVPHFIKGITGRPHQTPFGRPSSAVVNVIWGWVNFAVAAVVLHFAHPWPHLYRAGGLFALAALAMAILLAQTWSAHPEHNTPKK